MTRTRRDFLKRVLGVSGAFGVPLRVHAAEETEVGKIYDGWREGELDIHLIYTGRGEAIFHIFPDGTSMLLDAGDWQGNRPPVEKLPDTSRRAGEWVARYLQRINPFGTNVDYMMLSHYHPDHGGQIQEGVEIATGRGDYGISGLAQVAEFVHFDTAFDRGYPDYETPVPVVKNPAADHFIAFSRWAMKEKGLRMEKFEPGRLDQIRLRKDPSYDFHVRNLTANGIAWTGVGGDTHNYFPDWKEEVPRENPLSLSLTIRYGAFRYYTGGDLDTAASYDDGSVVPIEAAAGAAAGPVDVCKANHHVANNASTDDFIKAVQPGAYVSTVWTVNQPQQKAIARMMSPENYAGSRFLYPTLISPERLENLSREPNADRVRLVGGHVAVKVFDSGRRYKIYYLTAQDESMTVKAVYGPFESTGTERYEARKV